MDFTPLIEPLTTDGNTLLNLNEYRPATEKRIQPSNILRGGENSLSQGTSARETSSPRPAPCKRKNKLPYFLEPSTSGTRNLDEIDAEEESFKKTAEEFCQKFCNDEIEINIPIVAKNLCTSKSEEKSKCLKAMRQLKKRIARRKKKNLKKFKIFQVKNEKLRKNPMCILLFNHCLFV